MEEILNKIKKLNGLLERRDDINKKQAEIKTKQAELKILQTKRSMTMDSITTTVLDEQIQALETEIEGLNETYKQESQKAREEFENEKAELRRLIERQKSLYKRRDSLEQERAKGLEEVKKGREEAEKEFSERNEEIVEEVAQAWSRRKIYEQILEDAKATHENMVKAFSEGKLVSQADLKSVLDEISANEKKIEDIDSNISRMKQEFENDKQARMAEIDDYEERVNHYTTVEDNMEEIDDLEHLAMSLNSFTFDNLDMLKNSPVVASLMKRFEIGKVKTSEPRTTRQNEEKDITGEQPTQSIEIQEPVDLSDKRLPVRSFWEIYNDTCTQHVGSIARNINKLAHMNVLPDKNEDTVHKALNVLLTVFKAPTKLIAKIPNAIMGTDKKIAEMKENIDNLTPEEFQVLVESPERVNEMFGGKVKDEFDRDYLDSQFMKQYKVNNAYLDAVRTRLGRERGLGIEYYRNQADTAYQKIQELESIGQDNWTEEQKIEYNENMTNYQRSIEEGKKLQAELDSFDEGAKKKSSAYRNISGWFLAKFNPDNRDENAKMAELAKSRREAGRDRNVTEVSALTGKMQRLLRENTDIRGGKKNYIDIGSYSIESPVETLDRGPQTKGRLLLTNIALVTSAVGVINQVKENVANREMVEAHNKHLEQVNEANTEFKVSGEAKVSDSPDAPQTEEAIARQTVEAGWNRGERGDLDATNWTFNQTYRQRDFQTHTEGAQVANETESLIQQGDTLGALKNATDYYTRVQDANRVDIQDYIPTHTQYDYTAFNFGDSADMAKVYDFFANGVVPYETTVNGIMADLMPALREGVDLNGVIFAGANALYQAQREGRNNEKDFRENLRAQRMPDKQKSEGEDIKELHRAKVENGAKVTSGATVENGAKVVSGATVENGAKMLRYERGRTRKGIKIMPDLSKKEDKDNAEER